jgi:hypothetical protein
MMAQSTWKPSTSRFALAAAFAVALCALPFGVGGNTPLNSAAAQAADSSDHDGAAEEFMTDPRERVGGTGTLGVSSGEQRYGDPASVNVTPDDPAFQRYQQAAESNDLDDAARELERAADRPVTPDYVVEVNEQLGVRTSLTAEQIAEATKREPLPY